MPTNCLELFYRALLVYSYQCPAHLILLRALLYHHSSLHYRASADGAVRSFFSWLIPEASLRFKRQLFPLSLPAFIKQGYLYLSHEDTASLRTRRCSTFPFTTLIRRHLLIGGTAYSSIVKELSHFTYDTIPAWVPVHQHFMTCWDYARSSALRYFYPRRHVSKHSSLVFQVQRRPSFPSEGVPSDRVCF